MIITRHAIARFQQRIQPSADEREARAVLRDASLRCVKLPDRTWHGQVVWTVDNPDMRLVTKHDAELNMIVCVTVLGPTDPLDEPYVPLLSAAGRRALRTFVKQEEARSKVWRKAEERAEREAAARAEPLPLHAEQLESAVEEAARLARIEKARAEAEERARREVQRRAARWARREAKLQAEAEQRVLAYLKPVPAPAPSGEGEPPAANDATPCPFCRVRPADPGSPWTSTTQGAGTCNECAMRLDADHGELAG